MLISELIFGIGNARLVGTDAEMEITLPFCDTGNIVEGGLFICIRGVHFDGHSFAALAVTGGAAAVVCEEYIEGIPSVIVEDTRKAAAVIWNNYYKRPAEGMRLFGITGTCGKTTTAMLLSSCFAAAGIKSGTVGTLGVYLDGEKLCDSRSERGAKGGGMTTPDPEYLYKALGALQKKGVTHCVMEVSSHGILQKKTAPLTFCSGVFTNLSPEHLDTHKSMEEYFNVKASFIKGCERKILWADDPYVKRLSRLSGAVCVGTDDCRELSEDKSGHSYVYRQGDETVRVESRLLGSFNVSNTLMCAACALDAGIGARAVEEGIRRAAVVKGRLERVVERERYGFEVYIDFAHTPSAMEAVLSALKGERGRLICVFGCGGERDRKKRPLMGAVAEKYADTVIVTNDNPRGESAAGIIEDILSGMEKGRCTVVPDRKEAIYCAVFSAREGDRVVLCGKGHEEYELLGGEKRYFNEKMIVEAALKERFGS